MLRERHLFPQDCPQLGVERGGVEGAGADGPRNTASREIDRQGHSISAVPHPKQTGANHPAAKAFIPSFYL